MYSHRGNSKHSNENGRGAEFDIVEVWSFTDTECDDELMLTAIE
jgi:hypothetical protein